MRIFLLSLLLAGAVSILNAQNATEKLSAFFPFAQCDGSDESGFGSSAALDGTVKCTCGVRDSAVLFDSDDDAGYFVGPLAEVFTTSDFTVSFYMKPKRLPIDSTSAGATQLIMAKQDACDRQNAFWVRYRQRGQNVASSNVLSTGISQNDTLAVTLSAKLDDDRCWQHIVLSRNGTKYTLYVNGVKRDEKTSAVRIDLTNPATLRVAEPVCVTDASYRGELDELRFYYRAFNEESIRKELALRPDEIVNGDTLIYLGNSFLATTTATCAQQFSWSPLDGVDAPTANRTLITPTGPTTYAVQFLHPDGCVALDTIRVKVIDPDTLDCTKVFIPNAFTPGASAGRNDVFGISNPFAVSDFISFEVFDRWGGRVFNAETQFDSWDGNFGGKATNPGVFLYRLRYRCKGEEKVRSGTLTLLR